jgi:hypothetical protein
MLGERALEYAKRAGLNEYYTPQVEVDLGGVSFLVYGSMSWTVANVRTMEWANVHKAYVSITGDSREEVDQDAARNVVAGELQKYWADCQNRQDLKTVIDEQQAKRIEFATQDPPVTPAGSHAAQGRKRGGSMATKKKVSKKKASDKAAEKKPKKEASGGSEVPQRGASGLAAKLIGEGDHSRESVTKKVTEAFPDVKNVAPAVSYAARCVGVTLE